MSSKSINSQGYFFTVNHVTNESATKRIYGISLNDNKYFLSKSLTLDDCEQLDVNPPLDPHILKEVCGIIEKIENSHKRRPSLETMNKEIFKILDK